MVKLPTESDFEIKTRLLRERDLAQGERDMAYEFIQAQVEDAWGTIEQAIESGWYGAEVEPLLQSILDWKKVRWTAL